MVKTVIFEEELEIPKDVSVEIEEDGQVIIKGPAGGPIKKDFSHARGIAIKIQDNKLKFMSHFPKKATLALAKTIMNIIKNLITGVQTNFKYVSKVCYSHFPCSVRVDDKKKIIYVENFLGERAPRKAKYPDNVKVDVKGD
ncbi:MAG: 50S ribosomal protein L6, partial [Candidatus Hermodarchaeota archaeon]